RVAYLLEAERAETSRVRAFRRAGGLLAATDPDRVAALAASGPLHRRPRGRRAPPAVDLRRRRRLRRRHPHGDRTGTARGPRSKSTPA
ncbi:MAG: hypothetical protein ACRDYZ_16600, partial [Acidimicrobiales bacterium]